MMMIQMRNRKLKFLIALYLRLLLKVHILYRVSQFEILQSVSFSHPKIQVTFTATYENDIRTPHFKI